MEKKKDKIYWLARILGIIFILFISLFALDVFIPGYSLGRMITAFLIHLAPAYILTLILIIAWFWELIGGILYLGLALAYIFLTGGNFLSKLPIATPLILLGILFIGQKYCHKK